MSFLKKLFKGKDEEPIHNYADFWTWFENNEKDFYQVVTRNKDIEKNFLDKLSPKLSQLNDGYYFLTGMLDDNTVELVFTADGNIKNMVFIEELVAAAPQLKGWKFTAHKPPVDYDGMSISLDELELEFNRDQMSFYPNESAEYPDEIDITIVHKGFTEENKNDVINGVHIYLDNLLGELDFANLVDTIEVEGPAQATGELIPIEKLKDYLVWRQKEFVEKYDGIRYNTKNDTHSILEAKLKNGNALIAVINTELLKWDSKASHPWISEFNLSYDGSQTNGMPTDTDYRLLDEVEEELLKELKDHDGHLNVGRQTAENKRTIWFASKDFRHPARVMHNCMQKYSGKLEIEFDIYKDKYWQTFNRFAGHP